MLVKFELLLKFNVTQPALDVCGNLILINRRRCSRGSPSLQAHEAEYVFNYYWTLEFIFILK